MTFPAFCHLKAKVFTRPPSNITTHYHTRLTVEELLLVVLVTAVCRCLRLWGGVCVLTEGGGDMLSRLTGVGGALSALGREMPVGRGTGEHKENVIKKARND